MDYLVEQLANGTLNSKQVNFDLDHINFRSVQREIPMSTVKNSIFNGKMLSCRLTNPRKKEYRSVFRSPLKGRGNIIICFAISDNRINITTVIEDKLTAPKGRRDYLKYPEKSEEEMWEEKAYKKLRHYW